METPPWSGSLLRLPYNIDVSDSNKPDVTLVEYIGRNHPVSYYGTQLGTSSSWSVDIDKNDIDTLYALRRLARWTGDTTERNLLISTFLKNNVRCYFGGHNHYSHFSDMGLYDYCCPSFRFNEAWTVLHVNENDGTAVAEFSK